jgi:hypothetical protein
MTERILFSKSLSKSTRLSSGVGTAGEAADWVGREGALGAGVLALSSTADTFSVTLDFVIGEGVAWVFGSGFWGSATGCFFCSGGAATVVTVIVGVNNSVSDDRRICPAIKTKTTAAAAKPKLTKSRSEIALKGVSSAVDMAQFFLVAIEMAV